MEGIVEENGNETLITENTRGMRIQKRSSAGDEEDLDLVELWRILLRRKHWILAGIVVSVVAALSYSTLKGPVYQASVALRIGQVAGSGPFEAGDALSARLLAAYGREVADGIERKRPFLKRATVSRTGPASVELVAEGDRPEDAAAFLKRISLGVQAAHANIHKIYTGSVEERLGYMQAKRILLETQYQAASGLLERLKRDNPVQASLIALEMGRIAESINRLDEEKPELVLKLSQPNTQPTELIGEIVAPAKPVGPRLALIVAFALGLGLVAGALLAFAVEFCSSAAHRR